MKHLNEILFINEHITENSAKWTLSFLRPDFAGDEGIEISEEDAHKLLRLINHKEDLPIGNFDYLNRETK